jgi:hypothetical protein
MARVPGVLLPLSLPLAAADLDAGLSPDRLDAGRPEPGKAVHTRTVEARAVLSLARGSVTRPATGSPRPGAKILGSTVGRPQAFSSPCAETADVPSTPAPRGSDRFDPAPSQLL